MKSLLLNIFLLLLTINTVCLGQSTKYDLKNDESLKAGKIIYSNDKKYKLVIQNNALLIKKNVAVIWQSDWMGSWLPKTKIDRVTFNDGDITCYFHNAIKWSSKTKFPNSKLIIGNDGIIKIATADNTILWENCAVTANSTKPPLVSGGEEGPFTDAMVQPTNKLKLFVVFVDWSDAKATENNFDSIWNLVSGNGELIESIKNQGKAINLEIETQIAKKWMTLPKPMSSYFPPETPSDIWDWQTYIKDCPELLNDAFGLDTFTNNSIAIFLPTPSAKDKWKEGVPSGNLPINFHGLRSMISISPRHYDAKYATLMHEIGHSFGSGELYAEKDDDIDNPEEIMGLDVMGDSHSSTGFMGYHRYRYGWMPFVKEKPQSIYLTEPHSYGVTLTPLSANAGISMILIPDIHTAKDSLQSPSKLWGIEIGQDVQTEVQYFDKKNEKVFKEGDRVIIYSVEYPYQPHKRAIRLISKTGKPQQKDERWSNVFLYKDGDVFQNADAPMEVKINRNDDGSFYLDIQVKPRKE